MEKITYTQQLKDQLDLVRKTADAIAKEEPDKTIEQFLAEIKFNKILLDELKTLVEPIEAKQPLEIS